MGVDEPGDARRGRRGRARRRRRGPSARRPTQATRCARRARPRRPRPARAGCRRGAGSLVTSSPMPVSSRVVMRPSGRVPEDAPWRVAEHTTDVGGGGGEDERSRRWRRCRGCGSLSRSTVTRSARCPAAIRPASSKPSERWPSYVAAASSSRADQWPRCWVASRSCISTARISSNRSITAWLSEPSVSVGAGVVQPPRRADAVGEVALGGGAEADVGARSRRAAGCRRR